MPDTPWQYYLVSLGSRELLWLHDFDASWIVNSIDGVENIQQLSKDIYPSSVFMILRFTPVVSEPYFDFEFWCHIEQFPCHRKIFPGLLEELMGYTTYGCIGTFIKLVGSTFHNDDHINVDAMTSLDTTIPYTASNMRDLSGLIKQLICMLFLSNCIVLLC